MMSQRGPIFGDIFHHRPPANTRAWAGPYFCRAARDPPTHPAPLASVSASVVARGDVTLRLAVTRLRLASAIFAARRVPQPPPT